MEPAELEALLDRALNARTGLFAGEHTGAFRLFNGFSEGYPDLAVDVYARTLVLFGYNEQPNDARAMVAAAQTHLLERLPWIDSAVQKIRSASRSEQVGTLTFDRGGMGAAQKIQEHGVWYALDLFLNQDASLYLDTRELRAWLLAHSAGAQVLNMFAYTGSLGVAALAGGAAHVLQVDLNKRFLALARQSCTLNRLDWGKMDLRPADFFSVVGALKKAGARFECIITDPPFFSTTEKGTVDLANQGEQLINKLRPLVADGGWLVVINNALFLSGAEYKAALDGLCADGYLEIETLIPVPPDFTGFAETVRARPPADPAPFNHPTKIVVLRVHRK